MTTPSRPLVAVDVRALLGQPDGIGIYTRALLAELARRGRLELLGVAHQLPEARRELEGLGVRFAAQPSLSGVFWQQWTLPRWLARQPEIGLFWSPLQTLPWRLPVPAVTTVHDLTTLLLPRAHRLKVRWSQVPFLGRSLTLARRVVAISESTARDVRRYYPQCADRLRVVHNGVDADFRPAPPDAVEAIRRELGMPEGYVLFVGTLEPRKNVSLLLDAWETLRRAGEAPPLLLVGGYGWHSRELTRRIERLAPLGVEAPGSVSRQRLIEIMQAATLFVYPSFYEGFGLPAAEAMACGLPLVVSDAGSLPEVVGDAALRVDPHDAAALGAAMRRLLTSPALAARLAAAGVERAGEFRWDRAAAALEEEMLAALADG